MSAVFAARPGPEPEGILVFAADAREREPLRAALARDFRCPVEEAATAEEARRRLSEKEYRLVICDQQADGLELFRFLRGQGRRRTFFILFTDAGTAGPDIDGQLITADRPSLPDLADAIRFLGIPRRFRVPS
jgi:DNA-binding response OmpR family regulator